MDIPTFLVLAIAFVEALPTIVELAEQQRRMSVRRFYCLKGKSFPYYEAWGKIFGQNRASGDPGVDWTDAEQALRSTAPAADTPGPTDATTVGANTQGEEAIVEEHEFVAETEPLSTPSSGQGTGKVDEVVSGLKGKRKKNSMNPGSELSDAAVRTLKDLRDVCGQLLVDKTNKATRTPTLFAEMNS